MNTVSVWSTTTQTFFILPIILPYDQAKRISGNLKKTNQGQQSCYTVALKGQSNKIFLGLLGLFVPPGHIDTLFLVRALYPEPGYMRYAYMYRHSSSHRALTASWFRPTVVGKVCLKPLWSQGYPHWIQSVCLKSALARTRTQDCTIGPSRGLCYMR